MTRSILIVEDDPDMRLVLTLGLEQGGFRVSSAQNGPSALEAFHAVAPDLVLIDVLLGPDSFDGFELCKRIRKVSDIPLVFLTVRGSENDQLVGLGLGADDYLVKPVPPRVLCAKAEAILERRRQGRHEATMIVDDGLTIDTRARTVTVNEVSIDLTRIEFDLLVCLARVPERVRTRDEITSEVWGTWYGSDEHLDVHMSRLRRKVLDAGGPRIGQSVRGVGYRLR